MKVYNNVKSTANKVLSIEFNIDTVYVRSNIKQIKEENFTGWQYDEIQYTIREYLNLISMETNLLGKKLAYEKINNLKKDSILNSLGKELSLLKLNALKERGDK